MKFRQPQQIHQQQQQQQSMSLKNNYKNSNKNENGNNFSDIKIAVCKGEMEKIKSLNVKEFRSKMDAAGKTMLLIALENRQFDIFYYLLTMGFNVNHQDNKGSTCLHICVKIGAGDVMKILFDKYNAAADLIDNMKNTPLHLACVVGNHSMTMLIMRSSTNRCCLMKDLEGKLPIHHAAENGFDLCVQELLIADSFDYVNIMINSQDDELNTPLHLAASNNHTRVISILLKEGAEINLRDQYGDTPIHDAIRFCNKAAVSELLKPVNDNNGNINNNNYNKQGQSSPPQQQRIDNEDAINALCSPNNDGLLPLDLTDINNDKSNYLGEKSMRDIVITSLSEKSQQRVLQTLSIHHEKLQRLKEEKELALQTARLNLGNAKFALPAPISMTTTFAVIRRLDIVKSPPSNPIIFGADGNLVVENSLRSFELVLDNSNDSILPSVIIVANVYDASYRKCIGNFEIINASTDLVKNDSNNANFGLTASFHNLKIRVPNQYEGGNFRMQFCGVINYKQPDEKLFANSRFIDVRILPSDSQKEKQFAQLIWGNNSTAIDLPWIVIENSIKNYFTECIPVKRGLSDSDFAFFRLQLDQFSRGSVSFEEFSNNTLLYSFLDWLSTDELLQSLWERGLVWGFNISDMTRTDVSYVRIPTSATGPKRILSLGNNNNKVGWTSFAPNEIIARIASGKKNVILADGKEVIEFNSKAFFSGIDPKLFQSSSSSANSVPSNPNYKTTITK